MPPVVYVEVEVGAASAGGNAGALVMVAGAGLGFDEGGASCVRVCKAGAGVLATPLFGAGAGIGGDEWSSVPALGSSSVACFC